VKKFLKKFKRQKYGLFLKNGKIDVNGYAKRILTVNIL